MKLCDTIKGWFGIESEEKKLYKLLNTEAYQHGKYNAQICAKT